ncbi:MAG: Calx-beta domain-containing protein [Pirellulales bacterium]
MQPAKGRRLNRVGGGHFAIEPLEDRRMLAVLNLGVNLLADISGTPGSSLSTDTVNVGDTFYVEITALDVGGASNGVTGLSLDVGWDGAALELLNTPFNPVPFNGIITPNFPNGRGGTLTAGQDGIDELTGEANPSASEGFAIGNGSAQRFALLRFRADGPVTASAFSVSLGDSLGGGGVLFANGDPLDTANIDPQTITVASATPSFSIDDVSMTEGNSGTKNYTFNVSVANLGSNPVSVSYATNDGFATAADNDYVSTSGMLTFTPGLPGASTKTVTVVVNGDTLFEGDETFTVGLSNPSANAAIADGEGVGTIVNDDAAGPAAFEIGDAQVTEGDSGTKNMAFTVTLFNPPATPATVHYSLVPITASPGDDDYFPSNATLTFTPGTLGATQQTINIQINGDNKVELNETFQVVLDSPTGAVIADGEGVGTIVNDDIAVVSVSGVTIVEGNSGTSQAMVVVSMSKSAVLPVSVTFTTSDGTATTADGDYVEHVQQVTIPVNQTQVVVPITINGDTTIEFDETFTVTISGALFNGAADATRAMIGTASANVTITNDDTSPTTAQLSIANVTIAEGDSGTSQAMLTLTLSQAVDEDVTVTVNTASGTATVANGDFVAVVNQIATILAGQTSVVVPVTINGDATVELDETFTVALSNALVGGVSDPGRVVISTATATVTITGDDAADISIDDVSQEEGNSDFDFTITLSKPVDVPLVISTNLFDVTVPAGATTHVFTVSVANSDDNDIVEGERVAEIMLTAVQAQGRNVTIADGLGEAIVLDNDTATLSINDVEQEEAVGDFVFTLTLSKPVAIDVFVTITAPEGSDIITIPALSLTQTFTVLFDDNNIVEFDGDFDIVITDVDADGLPVTVAKATGVGTILDDDFADFTISDVSITEGDSGSKFLVFTVTTSHEIDADVTIEWATSDGTASAGSDYIAASGTISFPRPLLLTDPFVTSQTISIEILGDTNIEPDETFTITLSNLMAEGLENVAVFLMDDAAIGTIVDDDTPVPTLSISDGTVVVEGDSGTASMVFTVTLVNPPAEAVQVNYQTVDGTASSLDLDYADTFGTLVFTPGTAGATQQTISVPIIGDTLVELDETFTVELFTATGATIGDGEGTGTITDDDSATISIADAVAVVEGDSGTVAMTFTVTLSGEVDTDVTVTIDTSGVTATGGVDFVAITGQTITFTAGGALSQNITVLVNGDSTVEPDEVLSVVLSNISAGGRDVTFADDTADGSITDDDSLTISIGDVTLLEGTSGTATAFQFPITLSAPASADITVTVNTVDGTATAAGGDYTALVDNVVTIPAGMTTINVTVDVAADSDIETDEAFSVVISNALLGGVADGRVTIAAGQDTATGAITNDDAESMLSIADASIAEGTGAGTTLLTFTITMSAVQSADVTVVVNTSDGTATVANGDYTALVNFVVTISAGMTSATFDVEVGRDARVGLDEMFTVTLSNPLVGGVSNSALVAIADAEAIGTILNDDVATVSISNTQVVEGNSGTVNLVFDVTLSAPVDVPVTVTLNTTDGTATVADGDYVAVSGQTITFNPDEPLTQQVIVTVNGDTNVEGDEALTLTLSNIEADGRDVTIATATGTGTIQDDDSSATVSIADVSVVEGDSGTTNMVFTVTLSAAVSEMVTVTFNTANGTATAGSDYQGISNHPVTFTPGGSLTQTVTVEVGGDTLVELDETIMATISNLQTAAAGVTLGNATATGTITNDDDDATITIGDVTITEGDSGTTNMTFTVTLSSQVDTDITLTANTANGTATAGTDYTAISGQTITISAGSLMQTITVSIAGDTTVEGNETLSLILSNLQAGGREVTLADAEATGTITNNDSATISIANASLVEGNSGTSSMMFGITLSAAVDVPVTVTLNTTDGTATVAGNDYVAVTGQTFTFNPGDPLTKTFSVTINGDTTTEQTENFTLAMSNVQAGGRNVSLGTASAIGTITNDDGPATAFLSIGDISIAEGNTGTTTMTFTVTLSQAVEEAVNVTVNSTNVTATAGADYTALVNQTVTIPAGSTSATVTVSITGDLTVEANETFTLTLSNPLFDGVTNLARVALDTDNTDNVDNVATGTITNDDVATLSIAGVTMAEGTGTTATAFTFTITMSNPVDRAVTVTVNTANGTATAGTDYTALTNQTVTIAAGQTSAQVTVNVTADSTVESNETFTATLSNPLFGGVADTARVALGASSSATGTITNDDGQATLSGFVYVDGNNNGVRETGEAGVPGVQVTLRRTDTTGTADVTMLTGGDGSYSFANVTPGTYSIIESHSAALVDGTDAAGSMGGTVAGDSITGIVVAGGAAGTGYNFGERGLAPGFVSIRNFLASTPEASVMLREMNARAAELAGNTALAASIRNGSSTVISGTISIGDASISESNSGTTTMTFNVTLSTASTAPVSVTVNTTNGTATTTDSDYVAITNQTLTFNPGDPLTKTVTVTINGDTRVEANETFTVNLSNIQAGGQNITIADGAATGTINNDDAATVSIGDATVTEGNSGTTNATFTVTLSAAVDANVSVTVNTANATATTTDNDYTAVTNQTLTFTPGGALTQTITVPVIGDTRVEANETFNVNLSNLTASGRNVTISDGTGVGTITNNDSATISIADMSVVEGNSGTTNLVFNVTMSNPVDAAVTVLANTTNGTATSGTDYTALSNQTITFNAGSTTATVTVAVTGDTVVEPNETFTITLSGVSASGRNVTIDDGIATGTITNDDTNSASLSIAAGTLIEGDSGATNMTFTVTLANPPASGDVTVQFATSNIGATAGTDYTATSGTLTFAQGTTSQTINVPILGDTAVEADEMFTVTLSSATNAAIGTASANGTITNDDSATISIADAAAVTEGDSSTTTASFTVTLSDAVDTDVTVTVNTVDDTATAGVDYVALSGQTITFTAGGALTQTITVVVNGDTTDESDETFDVVLSNVSASGRNVTLADASAVGTITDDDDAPPAPSLSIADMTLVEGDSGTADMVFTVTLANPPATGDVTVDFATSDGTAEDGSDYTATSGTLTFAQGTSSLTISVPIHGDTTVEADEAFTVMLSNATNATIGTTMATGTITNDDVAVATVSIADATIDEGTGAGTTELTFTITLSEIQSEDVTVTVNSAAGTATVADGDYSAIIDQTVTILAGQTTATVTSTIGRDDKVESDETFTVTLSNPLLGGVASASLELGTATATGTIANDDSATLSVDDVAQEEALGDQVFTITLSAPVDIDVHVDFDDGITVQTITIPAGMTSASAAAAVDDNTIVQFDFPFPVTLSNVQASGRSITILDGEGIGTIQDDDFADVTIANVAMSEGDAGTTIFTFTVMLTAEVEANVTMTFTTSDITANAGSDYVAQTGTVSFLVPANVNDPLVTMQTITIVVNGDMDVEGDETFTITLSDLDAEGLEAIDLQAVAFDGLGTTLVAIGTIENDDSGAPASIVAFAPTGGGLPGESAMTVGTNVSGVAYESLDSQAVDAAFSAVDTGTTTSPLSAGRPARRALPADEALDETIDWLAA